MKIVFVLTYQELTGSTLTGGVKELAELAPKSTVAQNLFKEFATNMADFPSGPLKQRSPEIFNAVNIKLALLDEKAPLIGAAAMFDDMRKTAHLTQ